MRKIVISKRAENSTEKLLDYLEKTWSIKVKNKFLGKLEYSVKVLAKYTQSGFESIKIPGLRMKVITKQTSVFYKFNESELKTVALFDNRMHPSRKNNIK